MSGRARALVLCDYWYPTASANSVCVGSILGTLAERYDVTVVSADCPPEGSWPDRVGFVAVGDIGIRRALSRAGGSPLRRLAAKAAYKPVAALNVVRFPVRSREWARRFERAAEAALGGGGVELAICVSYPAESLLAGRRLAARHPDVPFVAWLLDATAVGMYRSGGMARSLSSCSARAFERGVLRGMAGALFLSSARGVAERVHGRASPGIRFADPPLISRGAATFRWAAHGAPVRFLYTGTLARPDRDPSAFIGAMEPICRDGEVELCFAGESSGLLEGAGGFVRDMGCLPPDVCDGELGRADVLLSIGNRDSNLVPSKLFKYLSCGKPIVHVRRGDSDSCLPYLERYPLALVVDDSDPRGLRRAVEGFLARLEKTPPFEIELSRLFPEATPEYTVGALRELAAIGGDAR